MPCDDYLASKIALRANQIDKGLKEFLLILNLFTRKLTRNVNDG